MALESSEPEQTSSSSSSGSRHFIEQAFRAPSSPVAVHHVQLSNHALTSYAGQQFLLPPPLSLPLMLEKTYLTTDSNTTTSLLVANLTSTAAAASQQLAAANRHWLLLLFAILVLINLIVILGNILVIVAVYASAKLRNVTNIFIVSLATADLLLGVLVLPYALVYEVLDVWIFGQIWCRGWLVTDVWISTASILNLCAISIDRYVAVTRPVKYRSIMTNRRAKSIVMIVWLLSFIICFPPLLKEWRPSGASVLDSTTGPPHTDIRPPPPSRVLRAQLPVWPPEQVRRRRAAATAQELLEANESGTKTRRRPTRDQPHAGRVIEIRPRRGRSPKKDNDHHEFEHFELSIIAEGATPRNCSKLSFEIIGKPRAPRSRSQRSSSPSMGDEQELAVPTTEIVVVTFAATASDIPRRGRGRRRGARDIISSGRWHLLVGRVASLANSQRWSRCFSGGHAARGHPPRAEPLEAPLLELARLTTGKLIELCASIRAGRLGPSEHQGMIRFPFGGNFIVLNEATATTTVPLKREEKVQLENEQQDHEAHKSSLSRRPGHHQVRTLLYGKLLRNAANILRDSHLRCLRVGRPGRGRAPAAGILGRRADEPTTASKQIPAVASFVRDRSLNDDLVGAVDLLSATIDDRRRTSKGRRAHSLADELRPAALGEEPMTTTPRAASETSQLFPRRRRQLETERREEQSFNRPSSTASAVVHVNRRRPDDAGQSVDARAASNGFRSSGSLSSLHDSSGRSSGDWETKGERARATRGPEIIAAAAPESNQIAVVSQRKPGQFGAHDSRTSSPPPPESERKPKKDFISTNGKNRKNRGRAGPRKRAAGENKGEDWPSPSEQICARLLLVNDHDESADQSNAGPSSSSSGSTATAFIIISDDDDWLAPSATTARGGGSRISLVSRAAKEIKSISARPPPPPRGITPVSGGQGRAGDEDDAAAISGGASPNGRHGIDHLGATATVARLSGRNEQMATAASADGEATANGRLMPRGRRRRLGLGRSRSLAANDPRTATARAFGSFRRRPLGQAAQQSAAQHNEAPGRPIMQNGQPGRGRTGRGASTWPGVFGQESEARAANKAELLTRSTRAATRRTSQQTMRDDAKVAYLTNDLLPAARDANKGRQPGDDAHDDQFESSLSAGELRKRAHGQVNKLDNDETPPHANQSRIKRDNNNNNGPAGDAENSATCVLFHDKTYVIYSALGSFYIPMLVMVFFYSRIYLVASRAQKAMQRGYMTTKWPPMQTGGGDCRSRSGGGKRWSRSSFKPHSTSGGGGGGGLMNGIAAARRRAGQEDMRSPASVLQENGERSQRPSAGDSSQSQGGNESSYSGGDQINRDDSPERVTLRIHRRTEPPPAPTALAEPPGAGALAISHQQQLINSYQSFEVKPAPQQVAVSTTTTTCVSSQPKPPRQSVGQGESSESRQQDENLSLIRLVSLEQQQQRGTTADNSSQQTRRTRFSLDRGVGHLPRKFFFSAKKRASLPPPPAPSTITASEEPPVRVASPKLISESSPHQETTTSPPSRDLGETGSEESAKAKPEVASEQVNGRESERQRHGNSNNRRTKKTINTCHKCGRERLQVSLVGGGQRCKSADVPAGGRGDGRSNSYGPMPTIVVVSWNDDSAAYGHSTSAASHLLECQQAAQASMPALPMVERADDEEEQRHMLDQSCVESTNQNGPQEEHRHHCKHHHNHHHHSKRKRRHRNRKRSSHSSSGLSLVANLPQQVRKQSIMLLSSLTARSGETFRRLSMAAAHPLDSLMSQTAANKSRPSSRAATETGECGSDCSGPDRRSLSSSSSSFSSSAAAAVASNDDTTSEQKRKRPPASTSGAPTTGPKRTLDDYLMAVAGIDTSSSASTSSSDEDEDGDNHQDDDEADGSSSSSTESSSSEGGLTSMLRKENLIMIPSIQVVSPDDDDNKSAARTCSPAAGLRGREQSGSTTPNQSQRSPQSPQRTASNSSIKSKSAVARATSNSGADDLDLVDKKVKRTERLPPSAGLHRQGGLYESATSQRQSIVSSVLDMGELKSSSSSSLARTSGNLNCDNGLPPPLPSTQNKPVRHSPDLFRLLDVRGKRNKPVNTTPGQANGQLVVAMSSADQASSPQQVVRTQVVTSGRRRGAKRTSRWHAKRLRAETKAAKTVAIIVGGFIFCWLPFFTAYLSRAIICSSPDCIPQTWLSLSIWLGYMNSAINPVIYGLFSADFRHAFKNIVCRCRLRGPVNVPRSNHHIHHQVHRNHNQNTHNSNYHNLGQQQPQQQQTSVVSALVGNTLKSIM